VRKYIGIDFSGAARPWRPKCGKPTVWIATVTDGDGCILEDLRPVQELAGVGNPFERLVALLQLGDFEAAAIDAPFSLPCRHMPKGNYSEFLASIRALPNGPDRPFPMGGSILALGESVAQKTSAKPYRATEKHWINLGVNTRSTMWNGVRPGSPFAAACLSLLSRASRPVWPWHALERGMLVEAFPAAQLRHWGLPYQGYSGDQDTANRQNIVEFISTIVKLDLPSQEIMLNSPDALDAVLCCFAAIAVVTDQFEPVLHNCDDGMIAVLRSIK
jgi:Protein of unknown function (DUF429)